MQNITDPRFLQPYDFSNNLEADCRALIPVINLLGDNLVGLELGVFEGRSFLTMLHNCPGIKTLYGVDSYQPYHDFLRKGGITSEPVYTIDLKTIELLRNTTMNRIKHCGMPEKVIFLEKDTTEAAKEVENESLDFIFMDTCMTQEQIRADLYTWYSKVKSGGLFAGHDWNSPEVSYEVMDFRLNHGITAPMSTYDNTFMWIKP
jgi:predicted O-methyltransferase YrrM